MVSWKWDGKDGKSPARQLLPGLIVLVLFLAAVPAAAQFDLTMNMANFTPTHENQLFKLRVVDSASGQQVAEYQLARITQSDFSHTFNNILKSGVVYHIDAFADFNDNKLYDPPPDDHAWRIKLKYVTADTTLELRHTPQWTDIEYPNDGNGGGVIIDPPVACSCDLDGDGRADLMDVLYWLAQVRSGSANECLDYNMDGRVAISDLVRLLVVIRNGGCM